MAGHVVTTQGVKLAGLPDRGSATTSSICTPYAAQCCRPALLLPFVCPSIRWKLVDDIRGASDGEQQLLQQFDYAANSAKNGGRRTLQWLKTCARQAAPAA